MNRQFRKGKASTLKFYDAKVSFKATEFNKVFPLEPYFGEMIGDKKEVYIADIGAGMFSTTGSTWEGVQVHLYPSDILADEFNAILKKHNVVPVIPVVKEDMSHLSYPSNFFDIVHCVNALDHCSNPLQAIQEMERVCRLGGYIYLRHYSNNADYQDYRGFHEWNICKLHDDLLFWNKTTSFTLFQSVGWNTTVKKNPEETPDTTVISIFHKPEIV